MVFEVSPTPKIHGAVVRDRHQGEEWQKNGSRIRKGRDEAVRIS